MKKFLFTLAALMMVGSVFAEDYLYMNDTYLTEDQYGTNNIKWDVKAHFDTYVQAVQLTVTPPEGLTVRTYRPGTDLTINTYDDLGDPAPTTADLNFLPDYINNLIIANMKGAYDQSGNFMGPAHWAPGDYDQFIQIIFIIAEDFKGGNVEFQTEPSSDGYLGEGEACPAGQVNKHSFYMGPEQETPQTAAPTITWTAENGVLTVTATGNGSVKLYIDGVSVPNPYVENFDIYEGVNYVATATAQVEGELISETTTENINVPAEEVPVTPLVAPTIAGVTNPDGSLTVTVTSNNDDAVLYVNGAQQTSPYTYTVNPTYTAQNVNVEAYVMRGDEKGPVAEDSFVVDALDKKPVDDPIINVTFDDDNYYVTVTWPAETDGEQHYIGEASYPRGPQDYEVTVKAWVGEGTEWLASNEVTKTFTVLNNYKVYETPAPTVTAVEDDENMVITATGQGNVVLYVTTYDAETGAPTTTTYEGVGSAQATIARGDADVTVGYYATATYIDTDQEYDEVEPGISQAETATVHAKPVTPITEVGAPVITTFTEDGITGMGATITPTTPGSVVYYNLYVQDGVDENNQPIWVLVEENVLYEEPIWKTEVNQTYRVVAWATYGDLISAQTAIEFTVSYPTGIDEMMGGKTVAGVRYFNMAGQEMQEANGMTIVVTTYTDGTQTATKVMK